MIVEIVEGNRIPVVVRMVLPRKGNESFDNGKDAYSVGIRKQRRTGFLVVW